MKKKTKLIKNKYRLGTQEVAVPPKGSMGDVGQSTLTMAATGAAAGTTFGPVGTAVGAVAGAGLGFTTGMVKKNKMDKANKQAISSNRYIRNNDLIEDPNLMQTQEYKKGTKGVKANKYKQYPGGTQGIKLSLEEKKHLNALRLSDPEAYKKAMQERMGYNPTSAPSGSNAHTTANANWNNSVAVNNATYTPNRYVATPQADQMASSTVVQNAVVPTTPVNNVKLNTYTDNTQTKQNNFTSIMNTQEGIDKSAAFETQYKNGTKSIEVEKDELIFKKKGNRYILKADFKGGDTHAQGGEDYVATEGDVIFPGKDRKKVLNAYRKGDTSSLESMRMKLPKDAPKAEDGLDFYSYDNSYGYGVPAPYAGVTNNEPISLSATNHKTIYQNDPSFDPISTGLGTASKSNRTMTPVNTGLTENGTLDSMETNTPKSGNGMKGLSTAVELAPVIYNTVRAVTKPVKTERNYYKPNKYQYTDISAPARRASQEAFNVDKYNVNQTRGARGQIQSYLQQASNNKYKRLSDIGNFEGGRKMDVYNKNTEQGNQAQLTNLGLRNQYNEQDAQNKARRNDFGATAATQVSSFAQNRQLMANQTKRDKALTANDEKRLKLYDNMYNDYGFNPDEYNTYYKGKKKTYKKGTRKINRYK
jgi:hypothetical protein